jgi:hypothetical protein
MLDALAPDAARPRPGRTGPSTAVGSSARHLVGRCALPLFHAYSLTQFVPVSRRLEMVADHVAHQIGQAASDGIELVLDSLCWVA